MYETCVSRVVGVWGDKFVELILFVNVYVDARTWTWVGRPGGKRFTLSCFSETGFNISKAVSRLSV